MSNLNSRVKAVEQIHGHGKVKEYLCMVSGLSWDGPEAAAKGYKIQPCADGKGRIHGEVFYIPTFKELKEFEARPDVNLNIFEFCLNAATAEHDPKKYYPADYIPQGTIPPDLLP